MLLRAQEISVDRIVLIACNSIEVALSSILKIASGLSERHLRFDFSSFISQIEKISEVNKFSAASDTHPTLLLRSRALLWFSMTKGFTDGIKNIDQKSLRLVDKRIKNDLDKYADGPLRQIIKEVEEEVELWSLTKKVIQKGSFVKSDQTMMEEQFGREIVEKLKTFLSSVPFDQLENIIDEKLNETLKTMKEITTGNSSDLTKIQPKP